MTEHRLDIYLSDIGSYTTLSIPEERLLVQQMRAGSQAARDSLIQGNLKLVVAIAKKFLNSGLPIEDLIQIGNEGLIEAARDFMRSTDTRFKSFADDCIRHNLVDAIRDRPKHATTDIEDAGELATKSEIDTYAERSDVSTRLNRLMSTLEPNERAIMFKIASGYSHSDLGADGKRLLNSALRKSNHPARSRLLLD